MSFTEPSGDHTLFGEVSPITVREVEAVRDLAMVAIRPHASQVRRNPLRNATSFGIYHDSGGAVGSNLTDRMLSVIVRRNGPKQNTMRISFLDMVLSEEERYTNHRELYVFDWLQRPGTAMAHKVIIENFGAILSTRKTKGGSIIDTVLPQTVVGVFPVEPEDCDDLCDRMLAFAHSQ